MLDKIAIDIVLLPPDEIMEQAITINQKIINEASDKLMLNTQDCLPHITLMQAVIKKGDLDETKELLKKIASAFKPIPLLASLEQLGGNYVSFQISRSENLQALHEKIMDELNNLTSSDAKPEYFCDSKVRQSSIDYVSGFREKFAYQNFEPHITIGFGKLPAMHKELEFVAERLAICHLGNFNTCKKVLWETSLSR